MTMDVVILETGEVIKNVTSIRTEKQDKHFKKTLATSQENKEFNEQYGNFIFKVDSKNVNRLESKLKDSDLIKNLYLATYLDYDGHLKYDYGKAMSKTDVRKTMSVSDDIFYDWYNRMVEMKVVIEDGKGVNMNPNYCIKGSLQKNKDYNRIFINGIRHIYENNIGKNQKTMGLLIRLLPYINTFHNIICWNPKEENYDEVKPMTLADVITELGWSEGNEKRLMNAISKIRLGDNHPVMIFITDRDKSSHTIMRFHPSITYSGRNKEYDEQIMVFKLLSKIHDKYDYVKPKRIVDKTTK